MGNGPTGISQQLGIGARRVSVFRRRRRVRLGLHSHGTLAVALAAHIEYVRAREVHLGRRTAVYRVEVCGGAKLLALFTGVVYRKAAQPASLSAKVG